MDYLIIGHLACDLTPDGPRLGGTAAYSALTGRALGLRVGVVTTWGGEVPLDVLDGIQVRSVTVEHSTTFENIYTPDRSPAVHPSRCAGYYLSNISRRPGGRRPLSMLGRLPVKANRWPMDKFPASMLGLTPQGWLRTWRRGGRVYPGAWPEAALMLPKASAAVLSIEDVGGDEEQIEAMANTCRVLAVTEGPAGARLYWNGDLRRFRAPDDQ